MLEQMLQNMDTSQIMGMITGSGMLEKFKGKLNELLDDIAKENNTTRDKVGLMIKEGNNEKGKKDVMLYFVANGKLTKKFSLQGFIEEGQKMGII